MRGAVVHDPEHTAGVAVRWLGHDLGDETVEGHDTSGFLTAAEELRAVDIERGQVGPGAAARVLMFDSSGLVRTRGQGGVLADAGLNAGLLIGADHELLGSQGRALPVPRVEVEDASGLGGEVGITREDPRAVSPGADRVVVEPAPHGLVADRGDDPAALGFAHNVRRTQAGEGQTQGGR